MRTSPLVVSVADPVVLKFFHTAAPAVPSVHMYTTSPVTSTHSDPTPYRRRCPPTPAQQPSP
ncbi:MAG: hypothetical protein IPO91_34260 [Chloroflexi bacterium]|nr:hypothetical protein [Chloroflexota bacterium]